MPIHSNDQNTDYLAPFHQIAARIDENSRALAQTLDKNRTIYPIWSLGDATSSSYSMWRYWAEIFLTNDPDAMHEIMRTPGAIIGIALETLLLISISVLASIYEKKENNEESIQLIVNLSPYLREIIKGLKNAYKGWRSLALAITLLGSSLVSLVIPLGIILGVFAAIIRSLLLKMKENRKAMMKDNLDLIKKLKKLPSLSAAEKMEFAQAIKYQDLKVRVLGYLGVSLNGLLDGLYLYVGVLSLAPLMAPVLASMLLLCSVYTVACVMVRNYEHYDFELKLSITQTQTKLLLLSKELETLYAQLCLLKDLMNEDTLDVDPESLLKALEIENQICFLIDQFEARRRLLIKQSSQSYFMAGLSGLKNGLSAYSAATSLVVVIVTVLMLSSVAVPAALLVATISFGMVFTVGFVAYALYSKYQLSQGIKNSDHLFDAEKFKELIKARESNKHAFRKWLDTGLNVTPLIICLLPELFEIFRAAFSGAGKGEKFVEFIGLQDQVRTGHSHEEPFLIWIVDACCALGFMILMGLRALAKGFGRDPLAKISLVETEPVKPNPPVPSEPEKPKAEPIKTPGRFASKLLGLSSKHKSSTAVSEIKITRPQMMDNTVVPPPVNATKLEMVKESIALKTNDHSKKPNFSYGVSQVALQKLAARKGKLPGNAQDKVSKLSPLISIKINTSSSQKGLEFFSRTNRPVKLTVPGGPVLNVY